MGHKGIRDGGPPRRPGFRPSDVIGLPVARALVELAHEGYHAEILGVDSGPRTMAWVNDRVRLTVHDGLVTGVIVG